MFTSASASHAASIGDAQAEPKRLPGFAQTHLVPSYIETPFLRSDRMQIPQKDKVQYPAFSEFRT
jgi:hypothetical protein